MSASWPRPRALTRRQLRPHFSQVDPRLAALIELVGPYSLRAAADFSPFRHLAEAIVAQQISSAAARSVTQRLRTLLGCQADDPQDFPTPKKILGSSETRLRGAGLSAAKVAALLDLARKTSTGQLPDINQLRVLDDQAIIARLTAVRGIGPWTVQMMLMFQLGRPDVLPSVDWGVRQGFKLLYGKRELPTAKEIERYGERWAPYRSAAAWYLWRAVDRARAGLPLRPA